METNTWGDYREWLWLCGSISFGCQQSQKVDFCLGWSRPCWLCRPTCTPSTQFSPQPSKAHLTSPFVPLVVILITPRPFATDFEKKVDFWLLGTVRLPRPDGRNPTHSPRRGASPENNSPGSWMGKRRKAGRGSWAAENFWSWSIDPTKRPLLPFDPGRNPPLIFCRERPCGLKILWWISRELWMLCRRELGLDETRLILVDFFEDFHNSDIMPQCSLEERWRIEWEYCGEFLKNNGWECAVENGVLDGIKVSFWKAIDQTPPFDFILDNSEGNCPSTFNNVLFWIVPTWDGSILIPRCRTESWCRQMWWILGLGTEVHRPPDPRRQTTLAF